MKRVREENLENVKIMGLIGVILSLLSIFFSFLIPFAFIFSIVGIILIYLAISKLSSKVNDPQPKNYYLIYLVLAIISTIIIFGSLALTYLYSFSALTRADFTKIVEVLSSIGLLIIGFIIGWIIVCIGTYYLKKSYELVSKYTNVELFSIAGLLYFLGAILSIILVGVLVIIIGVIIELVAWINFPRSIKIKGRIKK